MSNKNIHLLDNLIEENKNYNNTIHALANMGQRMGIKGDSIIYNSFELIDVFNVNLKNENIISFEGVKENIDDYIGYLYYVNNDDTSITCNFGAIKKTQLLESKRGYINNSDTLLNSINCNFTNNDSNIFGEFKINNEESLKIEGINILNNINSYNKNSVIKIKNNHLYSLLFGKIVNSDNIEIIYNDFDLKNNELKYALRAIKGNVDNTYVLYEFDINDIKNPFLKVYNLNLNENNNLNNNLSNIFNTYFVEETNIDNLDISDINDIKSSKFIFEYFLNYSSSNIYNLAYNNENNTKLSLRTPNSIKDENELTNYLNIINYINNDINVLIPALIKYYHNNFFGININTIILRVLQNVYETMCYKHYISYSKDNINNKNINFNDNRFVLYFPLNYKITYECNKNNIFDIYNINDLYIHRLNLENYDSDLISYNELLNNILFSSNVIKQSMFDVYNLTFDYNSYYDNNYIANINIIYLHTLPYIDKSNYNWYINGQNSGLRSYINNSLFQYFVIINTIKIEDNDIQGEYLTNIPNDLSSYFNDNEFIVKNFEISYERVNNSITTNIDSITFKTLLPKISTYDLTDVYQNTLVISLSTINTANLNNVLMCTLWKYNDNDWEILKNSNTNDILDLRDFLNLGLLKYRSLNTKDYIFNYFGMLMNNIKDYHNPYGNEIIKLALLKKDKNNDLGLNLSVVSSNDISITDNKLNTDDINDITQNERYIDGNTDNIKEITRNNITVSNNNSNIILINSDDKTTSSTSLSYDQTSEINLENYKDYTFKNAPLLDLSEIILEHPQIINRLNLLSLDSNKYIYNTIIGVDLDKNKKNVFTIKPSSLNVDIGTKTLIDEKSIKRFKTLDTISIDFNNIELNGKVKSGLIRQELTDNSYILYKDIVLIGNDVIKKNNGKYYINILELLEKNNIKDDFSDAGGKFNLVQNNNDIEKGTNDIIYINSNISSIDNINICTKTLRVIKYINTTSSNNTKNIIMLV